jgi:putative SOS response-associated peptidase YedK
MCGCFALKSPVDRIRQLFSFGNLPNLTPRFNITPTQEIAVIRKKTGDERELILMRWGLVPSFVREIGKGVLINARDFTFYPCNPIVNNARNDTPACLEPLGEPD